MTSDFELHDGLASVPSSSYPPYVSNADDRERWDLAAAIAEETFGEDGPAAVWSATRALFHGPIPTWSE